MMSATAIETVRTMQTAIVTATTTATATRSEFVFVTATGSVFGTETETETEKRIGTARHFGFPRLTATSNWTPSNSEGALQPRPPTDARTTARNKMSQAVAGRLNAEACWSISTPTNTGRVDESRECAIRSTVNFSTVAEKEFVSSSLSSRAHDKQQANDRCHNLAVSEERWHSNGKHGGRRVCLGGLQSALHKYCLFVWVWGGLLFSLLYELRGLAQRCSSTSYMAPNPT
jgi:hypothetical protein